MSSTNWTTLRYRNDAAFGERIFVNVPYRAHVERSNKLTMWIAPVIGKEDEPGAWQFHAKSGTAHLADAESTELLASVFTLLAGHGLASPEKLTFSALAALAQRPQHHVPAAQREAAKRHIARQKTLELEMQKAR